jgi:phosphoglycerate dehydrogenase-like enzyme
MSFKLLIYPAREWAVGANEEEWPEMLKRAIPNIDIRYANSPREAMDRIGDVDAAYGDIVPELFERARNLRWIACPQAGPRPGYFHQALVESDVVVTNTRGIYYDHSSAQIMSYVLAFARNLHLHVPQKRRGFLQGGYETIHLPESTAVIVGVGGIGGETARLCSEFGMTVVGIDPRPSVAPPGVTDLYRPEAIRDVLPKGDFVIVTVPETPDTLGMFNSELFTLMKSSAIFINIGRGTTTVLSDLVTALQSGELGGAALDVTEPEPLPRDHALWKMPNVILTPHSGGRGPYLEERRTELFLDNCIRFNEGRPLRNVVDKQKWF